jgi:hypothetical protein
VPKPILGGFVICRPKPVMIGSGIHLMSDLHIGAPQVNYTLIKKELRDAAEIGDRIVLNGDIFDGILASDRKRFAPDCLHPRLHGRKDILNAAIDWAVELLSPYAHLIDMIGVGNHETALEKHHNVDAARILVYDLTRKLPKQHKDHVIHYGGYTGFIDYRVKSLTKKKTISVGRWVLYYHHGSGGSAPVTKGMIDFNRKDTWIDADCIWLGHKHNRWNASLEKLSCPLQGDAPDTKEVRHIMTGAYMKTYVGQSQKSLRKHGRRSNYAADAGLGPQGQGGARVAFGRRHNGFSVTVTQ